MDKPGLVITGSQGRIGRVLCSGLSDNFQIFGIDRRAGSKKSDFKMDIVNLPELGAVFEQIVKPGYLIHLAADPNEFGEWGSILRNNIIGTHNIYECARIWNIPKVIFASSNHVTGSYEKYLRFRKRPIGIHDEVRPDGDYATSKIFGEATARQYYELYGIKSICLRIGHVSANAKPDNDERIRSLWLSHRDLLQLVQKSLEADINFGIYYGTSGNSNSFIEISHTRKDLGYEPMDDSTKS